MDVGLNYLGEMLICSTLEAISWEWQIDIGETEEAKQIIHCNICCTYFYNYIGLKNDASPFRQRWTNIVHTAKWQFSVVYLDDVIIFSRSIKQHFDHIQFIVRQLSKARTSQDLHHFFSNDHIDYLRCLMMLSRPGMSTKAADKIRRIQHLKNVLEVEFSLVFWKLCRQLHQTLRSKLHC